MIEEHVVVCLLFIMCVYYSISWCTYGTLDTPEESRQVTVKAALGDKEPKIPKVQHGMMSDSSNISSVNFDGVVLVNEFYCACIIVLGGIQLLAEDKVIYMLPCFVKFVF